MHNPLNKPSPDDDLYTSFKFKLPKSLMIRVAQHAYKTSKSKASVIAIAIDNELVLDDPFEFHADIPQTKDTDEPGESSINHDIMVALDKMINFLDKVPNGVGVDSLVLARRDYGILDRESVLMAIAIGLSEKMLVVNRGRHGQVLYATPRRVNKKHLASPLDTFK